MNRTFRRAFIELTNRCNLSCPFCAPSGRQRGEMPLELFESTAAQAGELASVLSLHVLGEPLCHSRFPEALKVCSRLGLEVNLVTNGLLLDRFAGAVTAEPCVKQVSISLHALSAVPQEKRAAALSSLIDFAKRRPPRMIVGFRLRCAAPDAFFNSTLQSLLKAFGSPGAPASGFVRLADNVFLNFGGIFSWPGAGAGVPRNTCLGLKHHFGVLYDGRVIPCCADYDGALALGSVKEAPLAEILSGPAARALRESLSGRAPMPAYCAGCGFTAPDAQS